MPDHRFPRSCITRSLVRPRRNASNPLMQNEAVTSGASNDLAAIIDAGGKHIDDRGEGALVQGEAVGSPSLARDDIADDVNVIIVSRGLRGWCAGDRKYGE